MRLSISFKLYPYFQGSVKLLSLHAPVVFKLLFGWSVEENIKNKDFACFYENTQNYETNTKSRIRNDLRLTISVIGRFSPW
jgi:hypothetical protein